LPCSAIMWPQPESEVEMAERVVSVVAGSRLHFGMLSFGQSGLRQFGGAGAMIAEPALRLGIRESDRFEVHGPLSDRVRQHVAHLSRHAPWWGSSIRENSGAPPLSITVESAPPQHAGLGSGTQLGMALARGLAAYLGAPDATAEQLARWVGRGRRSAVGIHGTLGGGLIVEGGKLRDDEISPLVSRVALAEQWRFVLLLPGESAGLSGETEQRAFDRLPPVPLATTAALCRELVCELVPAASQGDFERFGESLYRYGRLAGECFAAVQGGIYASPALASLIERCRTLGVAGVGQSSWGPTVFALCRGQNEAEKLIAAIRDAMPLSASYLAAPDNQGLRVIFR